MTAIKDLTDAVVGGGTIAYNGYTFPNLRNSEFTLEPVYDEAGRHVVKQRLTLAINWFAYSTTEDGAAAVIEDMRDRLSVAGQTLQLTDLGFGDLVINQAAGSSPSGTHVDVSWGPKPGPLKAVSIGGLAWECSWHITTEIQECANTYSLSFLALNYSVAWSVDHRGLQRRTIAGYYEINQTRDGTSRAVARSADEAWNGIRVTVPENFRRASTERQLSPDRNRMDFAITDEELEGYAPPDGMIEATIEDSFSNIPPGFARWRASLNCSFECAPDRKPAAAAVAFMTVATQKAASLQKAAGKKRVVLPTSLRMSRDRLGRRSTFGMEWTVVACLNDLIAQSGLWETVPGTSWAKWSASMSKAWENRGFAGLRFDPKEDTLVDLCAGISTATIGGGLAYKPLAGVGSGMLSVGDVDEEHSWLAYENRLEPYREQTLVAHKPVQAFTPVAPPQGVVGTAIATATDVTLTSASMGTSPDVIQYRGNPTDYVLMRGKAMRLKYQPAVPALLTVEGVPVVEVRSKIDGPKTLTCFFDVPVYVVRWAILYRVDGYLSAVKPPANPALCCDPAKT